MNTKLPHEPMVSVRLMVYNNEPYIRQALDGILMQEVDFAYEIVVGDDFSTDDTLDIIKSYREQYPDRVRILDRPLDGKYHMDRKRLGRIHNFVDIVDHCKGRYIAILDGDDYWTDPKKLQLQVDYLESHPDFNITFHQAREFDTKGMERFTNEDQPECTDGVYLLEKGWHIRSASIVFRKDALPEWPEWVYSIESMDYAVQCMLTRGGGKIKYFDRCMCDYRIHPGNVSNKLNNDYLKVLRRNEHLLRCIRTIQTDERHIEVIDRRINDNMDQQFYQMRALPEKEFRDWIRILSLGWTLGKFRPANLARRLLHSN